MDITLVSNCQVVSPQSGLCTKCNEGYTILHSDIADGKLDILESRYNWRYNICVPIPRGCSTVQTSGDYETYVSCKQCDSNETGILMADNFVAKDSRKTAFCISQDEYFNNPKCKEFSPKDEGRCMRCSIAGVAPGDCNKF